MAKMENLKSLAKLIDPYISLKDKISRLVQTINWNQLKNAVIIGMAIALVMTVFILALKIFKERRSKSATEARLKDLEKKFVDLKMTVHDCSEYIRSSRLSFLRQNLIELKDQARATRNLFLGGKIKRLRLEIQTFENGLSALRDELNERFFKQEKIRAQTIFSDLKGNDLLTDEQLKAVLCNDDRNLIVAGAGSGKTRVIDFKVRYLVNHKKINPKKILILSFSRKSANDLVKKISTSIPGIEARTIHSFASLTMTRQNKILFDDSRKELELFIIKAIVEALKDKVIFRFFTTFYEKFFSNLKPLIFYTNLDDLRRDLKKLNSKLVDVPDPFGEVQAHRSLKTLRGEYVRSIDERYIADFLYLHDIQYEYERRYPSSEVAYHPDFYLPDDDVYLEHFAITSSGKPPPYFDDPERYLRGIDWKRNLHSRNNTRMIESYSYLLNEKDTSSYLTGLFLESGIEIQDEPENDDYRRQISVEFCRMFTKFYHAFKLSGLSLPDLKQKYSNPRDLSFLMIFENVLVHFNKMASAENKIDFNDMIIEAITKYRKESGRSYDYIIVDEFQDTSNLAMRLLDEVYLSSPGATFLSVGDDWQSIYGFNGSDVTLLLDFDRRYPGVSIQKLNTNFRSHPRIVDLGNRFISKNPTQIPKEVVSGNTRFEDSEIGFLSLGEMEDKVRSLPDSESILILYRYNDDCYAVLEYFQDFFVLDRSKKPVRTPQCTKNISMMTIHASKGLEARHVFLVFPEGNRKKFPSEMEDHFVFNMVKTQADDFPFSEERRLMYVAITRAEQNLYFVSHTQEPNSVFWDELKELVLQA